MSMCQEVVCDPEPTRRPCTHTHMHAHTDTHTHTFQHTCRHTNAHTHTHTHWQTPHISKCWSHAQASAGRQRARIPEIVTVCVVISKTTTWYQRAIVSKRSKPCTPPRYTHAHAHTDNIDKECPNFSLLPSYVLHLTDRNLRPTRARTHVHAPTWPALMRGHSNARTPHFVTLCDTVLWNTDTNARILRRQGLQRASAWHPSHLDVIIDKRHSIV